MVEKRRDFFGHEGVQSAITEMLANGPQRRGHQRRVAVVFELDRQDFERGPGHCVFFKLNVRLADFSKLLPIGFAAAMKRAKARAPERGVQRNLFSRCPFNSLFLFRKLLAIPGVMSQQYHAM